MSNPFNKDFPLIILVSLHRDMHLYMSNNWLKGYGIVHISSYAWPKQLEDSFTAYFVDEQSRLDFQLRYL